MKRLTDFPEYVRIHDRVQALKSEEQQIIDRLDEIQLELIKPKRQIDGQTAWDTALEDEWHIQIDSAASLREEFSACEGRLNFIREALSIGNMELDKVHGKYSREICETIRPDWIAQIRQILEHVKAICEANDALERMRADLERDGIRTGSLPHCTFDVGGRWNDQYGGRVVGYQRYISESYPELTSPAGQEIRKKRAELAAKVQSFEKEGATS